MTTRKSKKDKGDGVMRAVVADNLRIYMERFFKDRPQITNRTLYLAEKAELGLGTVQRTLSCETGASIDTIESLARVLGVRPFELLMPSKNFRAMLSVDAAKHADQDDDHPENKSSAGVGVSFSVPRHGHDGG